MTPDRLDDILNGPVGIALACIYVPLLIAAAFLGFLAVMIVLVKFTSWFVPLFWEMLP